jgi:predicted transcriptional regulator
MTVNRKNSEKSSQNNDDNLLPENVLEQNEIRLLIWGLLNIYNELSFTEIAQKLGKSKSTIHPHLHKLIDVGLVKVSKQKKVRGSIPAKYYSMVPNAMEKTLFTTLDVSKGINKEMSQNVINASKSKINYSKLILDMSINFWEIIERLDDSEKKVEILKNIPTIKHYNDLKYGRFNHTRFFLTEEQYRRWLELYFDLAIKFDTEISKEYNENPNVDRPYYFFAFILPIKYYIETLGSEIG